MQALNLADVVQYVEDNIGTFHQKRISAVSKLKLPTVLGKKNPYLFKAKYVLRAQDIIEGFMDAYISSQEETIFGDWLEGVAIFINQKVYNGRKSSAKGVDLEFEKEGIWNIVTIKSGPNWGNSSQIAKMVTDFKSAIKTLRTSNSQLNIRAVNGCCYGRDNNSDKGDYLKYCGQKFWDFISNDAELYLKIIEPLGHKAKERNDEFQEAYAKIINKFTGEFLSGFCRSDHTIDWDRLVKFNSSLQGASTDPTPVLFTDTTQ